MPAYNKFVVWDWNGTLLDDTQLVLDCINKVFAEMKRPQMDMTRFRDLQIRPLANFYRAAGLDEAEVERALENERAIFDNDYEPKADHMPLRPGAAALLKNLNDNGVDNVILSNHLTDQIARLLDKHTIRACFGEIIAYATHKRKSGTPSKGDKLRAFIAERKLTPANAIIVGDTLEEIEIARDQGLTSVAITGGIHSESRLRELRPDHVVLGLKEMNPILRERGFLP